MSTTDDTAEAAVAGRTRTKSASHSSPSVGGGGNPLKSLWSRFRSPDRHHHFKTAPASGPKPGDSDAQLLSVSSQPAELQIDRSDASNRNGCISQDGDPRSGGNRQEYSFPPTVITIDEDAANDTIDKKVCAGKQAVSSTSLSSTVDGGGSKGSRRDDTPLTHPTDPELSSCLEDDDSGDDVAASELQQGDDYSSLLVASSPPSAPGKPQPSSAAHHQHLTLCYSSNVVAENTGGGTNQSSTSVSAAFQSAKASFTGRSAGDPTGTSCSVGGTKTAVCPPSKADDDSSATAAFKGVTFAGATPRLPNRASALRVTAAAQPQHNTHHPPAPQAQAQSQRATTKTANMADYEEFFDHRLNAVDAASVIGGKVTPSSVMHQHHSAQVAAAMGSPHMRRQKLLQTNQWLTGQGAASEEVYHYRQRSANPAVSGCADGVGGLQTPYRRSMTHLRRSFEGGLDRHETDVAETQITENGLSSRQHQYHNHSTRRPSSPPLYTHPRNSADLLMEPRMSRSQKAMNRDDV